MMFISYSNVTLKVTKSAPICLSDYEEQGRGAEVAGASPYSTGIDEETRLLLRDQHLLIERQFLTMGEILGAGR